MKFKNTLVREDVVKNKLLKIKTINDQDLDPNRIRKRSRPRSKQNQKTVKT